MSKYYLYSYKEYVFFIQINSAVFNIKKGVFMYAQNKREREKTKTAD